MFKPSDIVVDTPASLESLLTTEEKTQIDRRLRGFIGPTLKQETVASVPWTQEELRDGRFIGGFCYDRAPVIQKVLSGMGWDLVEVSSPFSDGRTYLAARPKSAPTG